MAVAADVDPFERAPGVPLEPRTLGSQGPGPHTVDAATFAATFRPSEYGPTWRCATIVMDGQCADRDGVYDYDDLGDLGRQLARNGQQEPVKVLDGCWVVDGHHRAAAAIEAGLPVTYEHVAEQDYDGQVPWELDSYERWRDETYGEVADQLDEAWPDPDRWQLPTTLPGRAVRFGDAYLEAAGGIAREGMCGPAAWNVRRELGLPMAEGDYVTADGTRIPHVWNVMPDGVTIVDVTAGQFDGQHRARVFRPDDGHYSRYQPALLD